MAADQFGVERLKKMCEKAILQSITVESAACAGKRGQGRMRDVTEYKAKCHQ